MENHHFPRLKYSSSLEIVYSSCRNQTKAGFPLDDPSGQVAESHREHSFELPRSGKPKGEDQKSIHLKYNKDKQDKQDKQVLETIVDVF